uniref:Uncharacterized protein n=1 Tax=Arundo donax TaxID=35708 RepID=A0A0A9BPI3_ARUDO
MSNQLPNALGNLRTPHIRVGVCFARCVNSWAAQQGGQPRVTSSGGLTWAVLKKASGSPSIRAQLAPGADRDTINLYSNYLV